MNAANKWVGKDAAPSWCRAGMRVQLRGPAETWSAHVRAVWYGRTCLVLGIESGGVLGPRARIKREGDGRTRNSRRAVMILVNVTNLRRAPEVGYL